MALRGTARLWVLVVLAWGCERPLEIEVRAESSSVGLRQTPADVDAAVIALEQMGVVTSQGINAGGMESESYRQYIEVAKMASPAQLRGLLSHRSPVVRAYMGEHFALHGGVEDASLRRLLDDEAVIDTQYGCVLGQSTVGSHVLSSMCIYQDTDQQRRARAARILREVGADQGHPLREDAARCIEMLQAEKSSSSGDL